MSVSEQTWTITEFVPKEATADEWRKFHEYRRIRHMDLRPDDPIIPDELVEEQMKMDNPFGENWHFTIYDGNRKVSGFSAGVSKPEAPGYESGKHLIYGGGGALKEYRRRGIGRLWLRKALELTEQTGRSVFTSGAEEDDGHAFLRWAGFEEKLVGAENRLNFKEIDWDMVSRWISEGPQRSPDTKLEFYENRLPEDFWEEYATSITPLLNTMPFDDLDHGEIVMTAEVLREHYRRGDAMKAEHHVAITREPDGNISGMTDVFWIPSKPTFVEQQFTGVDPDARGRGLGKWLKAYMLNFLRDRYDGLEWVSTGNANSNDPMLAINKKLGFKEFKGGSSYQISKEKLAEKVASL